MCVCGGGGGVIKKFQFVSHWMNLYTKVVYQP